ncbi:hypothetical protein ACNOYE_22945 [Nannocystaceae bacterium ST9]
MPGFVHDGVVLLLERHPEILLDLWADASGHAKTRTLATSLLPNELRITFASNEVRHFRPDILMSLHRGGRLVGTLSTEIQGIRQRLRALAWEIHHLLLFQFFGIEPWQLTLALGLELERWVLRQIAERHALRHMCVVGPGMLARCESLREARERPYHAALSVAVHRRDATMQMCEVALRVLFELSDPFAMDYARMVLSAVKPEMAKELIMKLGPETLQITAVERGGYLYNKAYGCGMRAGSRKGRKLGREEGRQEGKQEVRQELIAAIAALLAVRNIEVPLELLERLRDTDDPELLRRATILAGTAKSVDPFVQLVESVPPPPRRPTRTRTTRPKRR